MTARLPGVTAAALLMAVLGLVALAASPALAVEEDELEAPEEEPELPDFEELCEEGTLAAEYCPETYEEPSWFQWMNYPLLIVGLLIVTGLVVAYLFWQPRFAREEQDTRR